LLLLFVVNKIVDFRIIAAASSLPVVRHFLKDRHFLRERTNKKVSIFSHFADLTSLFITADVLKSKSFDSIWFCKKIEINSFLIGFIGVSSAHKFLLAKMTSETQKPLAKTEFLLICDQLAILSVKPWA